MRVHRILALLDAAYPASTAIKIILDNHSAHTSKETKAWSLVRVTQEKPKGVYLD
jgi:hypothetical protein